MGRPSKYKPEFAQRVKMLPCSVCDAPACLTSSRPWAARQQGATRLQTPSLAVTLRFVPPDRRARDIDNLVASMKSGLDGLADVLGVDDSRWALSAELAGEVGGFVRVEVRPCHA